MGFNKKFFQTGGIVASSPSAPAAGIDPYANFETVTYTGNGSTQKITGYIRKGAGFNGSSSLIDTGISGHTLAWGYSGWFNTTASSGVILASLNGSGSSNGLTISMQSGGAVRFLFTVGGTNIISSGFDVGSGFNDGNWHFFAFTWDGVSGNDVAIRIDNNSYSYTPTINGTTSSDATLKIGRFGISAGGGYLNGKVDQIRIFNKKLSPTELTTLYGETSATASTFDILSDSSAVALYQLEGNANDTGGTYNGTATNVSYAYNGTATNVNYLGMAFQPDLVWIKNRSTAVSHCLFDSIRGAGTTNQLYSDSISAQGADTTLTNFVSFDTNGFTLGATSGFNVPNYNGDNYVAWCWRGANTTTNVSASGNQVAADIRANTDGGFSIVKYTFSSPSASQTVPHGLNSAPEMIITKCTSTTGDWYVYHKDVGTGKYLVLNSGADVANYANGFATVDATAWQQYFRSDAQTHVAYCFHSINGYQKLGSYTGGGASNVTVSLGFQPRFVLIRSTSASRNWMMYDSLRDTGTVPYDNSALLFADSSSLELTDAIRGIQFTSDGFVLNQNYDNTNGSGETYIYLAIA